MAVLVSVIILTAIAAALAAGIKSNQVVKLNEQATGFANKEIENARNRPFADLNHLTTNVQSAAGVTGTLPNLMFVPIPGKPAEKIVHSAATPNQITSYSKTETINGARFTVKTYVTQVDLGAAPLDSVTNQTRRVTTIVSYTHAGATFNARSSTLITRTRRGLPEPKFEVSTNSTAIFGAWNTDLSLYHSVRNLGVIDAYDIKPPVATPAPQRSSWNSNFNFHHDTNGDGFFTPGTDLEMTDTNGNGYPDTGNVPTDATVGFFIVYPVPPAEPFGSATVTTTIASGASATVQQVLVDSVNINYALDVYYPYNQADFTSQPTSSNLVGTFTDPDFPWPMRMDSNPPGEYPPGDPPPPFEPFEVLQDYGANLAAGDERGPGRILKQRPAGTPAFNGALTATEAPYLAAWDHQVEGAVFGPTVYFYLWVANHRSVGSSNCDKPIKLKVYVNKVTGAPTNAPTAIATAPKVWSKQQALGADPDAAPSWHGGGCEFTWHLYGVNIADTAFPTGSPTKYLQLRVVMDDPGRVEPVLLGYGINYSTAASKLDIDFPTQLYMYRKS